MTMTAEIHDDAALVQRSAKGDREAFREIVGRYQRMVCAVAYSATGNVNLSEDVGQEVFVTAWMGMAELREPAKLKGWLCGIARNLSRNAVRSRQRDRQVVTSSGADIEAIGLSDSGKSPMDEAISREEEVILWRALEAVPEVYREPMVLFYRDGQSVERVAEVLDLSEETVRQRLSRGRKQLHERMAAVVEGALVRTGPRQAFSTAVMSALPALTLTMKGAALGATAAKGSGAAKAAGMMSVAGTLLAPFLIIVGFWSQYKLGVEEAGSEAEKKLVRGFFLRLFGMILAFQAAFALLLVFGREMRRTQPPLFAGLAISLAGAYTLGTLGLILWTMRGRRRLKEHYRREGVVPEEKKPALEYRSKSSFLGMPLVHVCIGGSATRRRVVTGWIAVGDCAVGGLFAFGGLAMAPFSIGGCALGLFAFGGCGVGILSIGGFAIGMWAFGGLALGWQAWGGMALGLDSAAGAIAMARNFAVGEIACAAGHANDQVAQTAIGDRLFFRTGETVLPYMVWMNLLWVVPLIWWRRIARRTREKA